MPDSSLRRRSTAVRPSSRGADGERVDAGRSIEHCEAIDAVRRTPLRRQMTAVRRRRRTATDGEREGGRRGRGDGEVLYVRYSCRARQPNKNVIPDNERKAGAW